MTGLASWAHIAAVRKAVSIPVFANGNIQYLEDVSKCMESTGVVGVMSAEGHLTNPALFSGRNLPVWDMCVEYLDLVDRYRCPLSYVRGHLFKMLHHCLQIRSNFDVRDIVAKSSSLEDFRRAVSMIRERHEGHHTGAKEWTMPEELELFKLRHPPWICQPYVRPPPEEYLAKMKKIKEESEKKENIVGGAEVGPRMSKKKMKKMERNPNRTFSKARHNCKICVKCPNPAGLVCVYEMCRRCCRTKCFIEELDCRPHKVFVKTNREKAREKALEEKRGDLTLNNCDQT